MKSGPETGQPPQARDAQYRSVLKAIAAWDDEGSPSARICLLREGSWTPAGGADSLSVRDRLGWGTEHGPLLVSLTKDLVDLGCLDAHPISAQEHGGVYDFLVLRITGKGREFLRSSLPTPGAAPAGGPVFNIGNFHGQLNVSSTVENTRARIGEIRSNDEARAALDRLVDALEQAADLAPLQHQEGLVSVEDLSEAFAKPPEPSRLGRVQVACARLESIAKTVSTVGTAWSGLEPHVRELLHRLSGS